MRREEQYARGRARSHGQCKTGDQREVEAENKMERAQLAEPAEGQAAQERAAQPGQAAAHAVERADIARRETRIDQERSRHAHHEAAADFEQHRDHQAQTYDGATEGAAQAGSVECARGPVSASSRAARKGRLSAASMQAMARTAFVQPIRS